MALSERVNGMTIAAALASRATGDPERPFLVHRDRPVTFGQVESRSDALAASLSSLGVEAGDRVALILPPCPEFVVSLFAAAKLGAVAGAGRGVELCLRDGSAPSGAPGFAHGDGASLGIPDQAPFLAGQ